MLKNLMEFDEGASPFMPKPGGGHAPCKLTNNNVTLVLTFLRSTIIFKSKEEILSCSSINELMNDDN